MSNKPNQNEPFERFAQAFKASDLGIQEKLSLLPESQLPHEMLIAPLPVVLSELEATIAKLNQLRSAHFYALRRRAFEERESMETAITRQREAESAERAAKQKKWLSSKLKGDQKKLYQNTGMLPIEFQRKAMEIVLALAKAENEKSGA